LERLGIESLFSVVVLTAETGVGKAKPHPAPFLNAVERLHCAPSECLFAGDNPTADIAGAARLGMRTVRVLTGPFSAESIGGIEPDFTIECISDIEKVLG
jgi:putative hydrolase of the HAD superfamily